MLSACFAVARIHFGRKILNITTKAVEYRDGDVNLTGQFAWDATHSAKRPGILVVHAGAGLDNHAKGRAKRFAALGFVAFACDMYGNGIAGDRQRVMTRIMELRKDPAKLCQRASAGLDVLRSHPLSDGRIAALGYCFGGLTVLELARSGADLAAAVSVHGTLDTSLPAQPHTIRAKILVCHGALDPHVPMTQVSAFVEEMNRAAADYQLIVYGGALHGFTHESPSQMPGVAYNAQADSRSSAAIKTFLSDLFSTPATSAHPDSPAPS
jgi:dienelactone hydrolase